MKSLDFTTLLETEPANLAVMSTFQFDATFFEQRLLRCPTLSKARRIVVFMDAGEWFNLLRQDIPARLLNRRYLVVPVRPQKGVFHPKLNLFAWSDGGLVQCGSNNLTRSGCTSNLELLNAFPVTPDKEGKVSVRIAQEAYQFFKHACSNAEHESGRIARQWLDELPREVPWLKAEISKDIDQSVRLVHTYDGSLWHEITKVLDRATPMRFFVISPYFDRNADLARRILQRWPNCQIEFVVQQRTTNLPVEALKQLRTSVSLTEIHEVSRRLHAKLIAWETAAGIGCLVGSANFSTAALDSRNVEACLLIENASEFIEGLFDGEFSKRPLPIDEFDPGAEEEPEEKDPEGSGLQILSAVLSEAGEVKVNYRHWSPTKPSSLKLAIRIPGERHPRIILDLPNVASAVATATLNQNILKDAHGTILASLIAELAGTKEESYPIWVIQVSRLTHEISGEGRPSETVKVEESGEGLLTFLLEIGNREGITAVIEYLRRLRIRFNDGSTALRSGRIFRLRINDPFRADVAPEWLLTATVDRTNLLQAIYNFTDRHDKQCLRKHANRGNINGMGNFLDVLTALVRLLYCFPQRDFVPKPQAIERLCRYVEIATCGFSNDEGDSKGYLHSLYNNLGGAEYLQEVCGELNFLGQVRAVLTIAQRIRFAIEQQSRLQTMNTLRRDKPPSRPSDCLPDQQKWIQNTIKDLKLSEPSTSEIMKALGEYNMFSQQELAAFELEIET